MEPRKTVKFAAKVREIDRQYEQNNNAELDNGVYHQNECDAEGGQSANDSESHQKQSLS